jgi:hypothetical protein
MKRFPIVRGLAIAATIAIAHPAAADPIAVLSLRSEPGDFIGLGQTFDFVYQLPGDAIVAQIRRTLPDQTPAELLFLLDSPAAGNQFALLFFGTDQLGIGIQPGTYSGAQRSDFAAPGHAGLDVSFQNRGSNTLTGSFTIFDLGFSRDAFGGLQIARFDAEFEQHSEGAAPALFGRFQFDASGSVVPEPGTLFLFATGGGVLLRRRSRAGRAGRERF